MRVEYLALDNIWHYHSLYPFFFYQLVDLCRNFNKWGFGLVLIPQSFVGPPNKNFFSIVLFWLYKIKL